jgi:hypothetical protein
MTWCEYRYICDPDHCDTLIEVTAQLPIVKPICFCCGRLMNLISIKLAEVAQ